MKSFLEEYGFAILAAIVVIILIAAASPVGTIVKREVMELIKSFSWSANHKLDSLNGEVSVILTPTPSLTITSPSSTDKFDYIIHYQEGGVDKQTSQIPYDGSISMPNCDVGSNVYVEVIDKGTENHYNSNTIIVPEGGFPIVDNKTYVLTSDFVNLIKNIENRSIGKISFTDEKMPEGAKVIEGLDADGDGGVVGWYIPYRGEIVNDIQEVTTEELNNIFISSQKSGQNIFMTKFNFVGHLGFDKCSYFNGKMLKFDMSNMTPGFNHFGSFSKEVVIEGLENWDTSNLKSLYYTFNHVGVYSEKVIIRGLGNWNTTNLENLNHTFGGLGKKAKVVIIEGLDKWNVGNVKYTTFTFSGTGTASGWTPPIWYKK